MRKSITMYIMAAAILSVSVVPTWAADEVIEETIEESLPVLTVEEAIKAAKAADTSFDANDRAHDLAKRTGDLMLMSGNYAGYKDAKLGQDTLKRVDQLTNDLIVLNVNVLFDSIISKEQEIELNKKEIELKEREFKNFQIMYDNGLMTQLQLDGAEMLLTQLYDKEVELERQLEELYVELNTMMGTRNQRYQLEKEVVEYKPYGYEGSINSLARRRADNNMMVWIAEEEANNAKYNLGGSTHVQYLASKDALATAEENVKNTREAVMANTRTLYAEIINLEAKYVTMVDAIAMTEKQLEVLAISLENSMITQLTYDQAVYEYEVMLWTLQSLVNGHSYLKYQLNHPDMIPA